jgi:hypothetical protein
VEEHCAAVRVAAGSARSQTRIEGASVFARRLGREITVLLLLKVAALVALFLLFFGPAQRAHIDAADMSDQLISRRVR